MKSKITKQEIIQKILKQELKDIPIKIIKHSDPTLEGLEGYLINESKNMLNIDLLGEVIMVSKAYGEFILTYNEHQLLISGNLLIGTAKHRSKRKHKGW